MSQIPESLPVGAAERTDLLRRLMNEIVQDYGVPGAGVDRIASVIDGTAFFPGGRGLWRGRRPRGPLPERFPTGPVLFLGHNFDSVKRYRRSLERGMEALGDMTWRKLLVIMRTAEISEERCFYSNVYMGLQPDSSIGELKASDLFKEQCVRFIAAQIRIIEPVVVVTLGAAAKAAVRSVMDPREFVAIAHPSSARRDGSAEAVGETLRATLTSMGVELSGSLSR